MSMTYHFYSCTVPVEGFIRSAIYDLQTDKYFFAPLDICQLIKTIENGVEHIEDLVKNNLVFFNNGKHFKGVEGEMFDCPSDITNAIVEIDVGTDLGQIFNLIEEAGCFNVQFILIGHEMKEEQLDALIRQVNHSIIKHCELVICHELFDRLRIKFLKRMFPELNVIYVYGAPGVDILKSDKSMPIIILSDCDYPSDRKENIKSPALFSVNTFLYTESLTYNTYYHRKLFIDINGNLKNGPLSSIILGNIYKESFDWKVFFKTDLFKELWYVNKDRISVCNVCEFRYMCVDSRIPVKHTNSDHWYQPSECNYNPFIAKWSQEDGYLNLQECGVNVSCESLNINYDKLKNAIERTYRLNLPG